MWKMDVDQEYSRDEMGYLSDGMKPPVALHFGDKDTTGAAKEE